MPDAIIKSEMWSVDFLDSTTVEQREAVYEHLDKKCQLYAIKIRSLENKFWILLTDSTRCVFTAEIKAKKVFELLAPYPGKIPTVLYNPARKTNYNLIKEMK